MDLETIAPLVCNTMCPSGHGWLTATLQRTLLSKQASLLIPHPFPSGWSSMWATPDTLSNAISLLSSISSTTPIMYQTKPTFSTAMANAEHYWRKKSNYKECANYISMVSKQQLPKLLRNIFICPKWAPAPTVLTNILMVTIIPISLLWPSVDFLYWRT